MTGEGLLTQALDLTSRVETLASDHRQMRALMAQTADQAVRLAVVGLSSGGKSSFLNALMGEVLLPEATGATTNVPTRCRKGPERQVTVHFRDGTRQVYQGLALQAEAIAPWCSEALNPGNEKAVDHLEWVTPDTDLPEGLVLVDTPGLDAFDHAELEAVTLRTCLPAADGVIYVAPMRHPLLAADLRLLDAVLTYDQRTLFVLTQADREADTYQGGTIWCTREAKVTAHVARWTEALAAHPKLRHAGVATVATPWAREGTDRDSALWPASGYAAVLETLKDWTETVGEALRCDRTHRVATHVAQWAERLLASTAPSAPTRSSGLATAVAELEVRWRDRLDPERCGAAFRQGLAGLRDDAAVLAFGRECRAEWEQLQAALLADMGELQRQGRTELEAAGLASGHWAAVKSFHVGAYFPESAPYLERVVRPGGWNWDLLAWKKPEPVEVLDRGAYAAALEAFVDKTARELIHYLGWWVTTMRHSTLDPLGGLVAPVPDFRSELEGLLHAARVALGQTPAPTLAPAVTPVMLPERRRQAAPALHPLIAVFREAGFQRDFMHFLKALAPERPPRRVLLLGAQREPSLRLAALLGHDLARLDGWRQAPAGAWLASGGDGARALAVPDTVLTHMDLVVAPADEALPPADWDAVLNEFDAVGVALDAARLGCGWSALSRAPYAEALARRAEGVFFTSADGGLFGGHRLEDLASALTEPGPCGARPWFVFEDYDARYTAFMQIMREVASGDGDDRELVRRWRLAELPEDAPFTESELRRVAQAFPSSHLRRRTP